LAYARQAVELNHPNDAELMALLEEVMRALIFHTKQTRPITSTDEALDAIIIFTEERK
jgi:hypothetical protein